MSTGHQFDKSEKLSTEQVNSVRSALASVISSNAFVSSKRCQDFLRLIVEHTLAGEVDSLRERMIGVEMFGRPVDYDTSNDAVVRVRATEVRKRLAQYYSEVTPAPVIRIELPPGSYVPEFHWSSQSNIENEPATSASAPPVLIAPRSRFTAPVIIALLLIASLVLIIWLRPKPNAKSINA